LSYSYDHDFLVKPPDIGGLRFYRDSSSISYRSSSLDGTQPKPAICSEPSAT